MPNNDQHSLYFVWVTSPANPKEAITDARLINLKHSVEVLKDWKITLVTPDPALIPHTTEQLRNIGIGITTFEDLELTKWHRMYDIIMDVVYSTCSDLFGPYGFCSRYFNSHSYGIVRFFGIIDDLQNNRMDKYSAEERGTAVDQIKTVLAQHIARFNTPFEPMEAPQGHDKAQKFVLVVDLNTIICSAPPENQVATFGRWPSIINPMTNALYQDDSKISDLVDSGHLSNPEKVCEDHPWLVMGNVREQSWTELQ